MIGLERLLISVLNTWFFFTCIILYLFVQVQQRNLGVSGRIFAIESVRARSGRGGNVLKLKVNFLPEIITLYKEVRNLKNLGFRYIFIIFLKFYIILDTICFDTIVVFFRVPLAIVNKAHQANQLYPFAISLIESVRTYERTLEKVCVIFKFCKFRFLYIKVVDSQLFY